LRVVIAIMMDGQSMEFMIEEQFTVILSEA
jgi:hypothetical protein